MSGTPACVICTSVPTDTFFNVTVTCISPGRWDRRKFVRVAEAFARDELDIFVIALFPCSIRPHQTERSGPRKQCNLRYRRCPGISCSHDSKAPSLWSRDGCPPGGSSVRYRGLPCAADPQRVRADARWVDPSRLRHRVDVPTPGPGPGLAPSRRGLADARMLNFSPEAPGADTHPKLSYD